MKTYTDAKKLTFEELSNILGISPKKLSYIIYKIPDEKKYTEFTIPKKTGGVRHITKPAPQLMYIQRKIRDFLLNFYKPKNCSFGFEFQRDIKKNAEQHLSSKVVLNIDIKDFFGSINFGRVYGLLLCNPFNFDKKAAAAVAKIVTYQNKLPQGAPTSPLISNMIARRLDSSLTKLASSTKSTYTRYVDDITFSTTYNQFDDKIVSSGNIDSVELGKDLSNIIFREGFEVNHNKSRQLNNYTRKEVTGITINEFPNIKRSYINSIFGMIYSWRKFGYDSALNTYKVKYLGLDSQQEISRSLYSSVIIGKISYVAHIRGWTDIVVQKLCRKYCECDLQPPKRIKTIGDISMKKDIFIGHASEQKDSVAQPLFDELVKVGINPFIDIVEIKWGESLTKKINEALSSADYFLAIISIDSIAKSWPDQEMNSAIARQIDGKQKILPLFVGTSKEIDKCKSHYPLIADRLYKEWNNNPSELANEIKLLIKP